MTKSLDKLGFSNNNGSKLVSSKNNNNKLVFKKNNSNNKIDKFDINKNSIKHTKKLEKLSMLKKSKSKKMFIS